MIKNKAIGISSVMSALRYSAFLLLYSGVLQARLCPNDEHQMRDNGTHYICTYCGISVCHLTAQPGEANCCINYNFSPSCKPQNQPVVLWSRYLTESQVIVTPPCGEQTEDVHPPSVMAITGSSEQPDLPASLPRVFPGACAIRACPQTGNHHRQNAELAEEAPCDPILKLANAYTTNHLMHHPQLEANRQQCQAIQHGLNSGLISIGDLSPVIGGGHHSHELHMNLNNMPPHVINAESNAHQAFHYMLVISTSQSSGAYWISHLDSSHIYLLNGQNSETYMFVDEEGDASSLDMLVGFLSDLSCLQQDNFLLVRIFFYPKEPSNTAEE